MNLIVLPTALMAAWIGCVFLIGLAVGSGLNVFIFRLSARKSALWPSSHCFICFQKIRWYDNIPILGYLLLRGKCRACQQSFSSSYLGIELITALLFVGLFYLEVVLNIHRLPILTSIRPLVLEGGIPGEVWLWFFIHLVVLSFTIVAFQITRTRLALPKSIGLTAMLFAITTSLACPWPWPNPVVDVSVGFNSLATETKTELIHGLQMLPWKPAIIGTNGMFREIPSGAVTTLLGLVVVAIILRLIHGFGRRLDVGSMLMLMAWGGLFGWQFGLLMLLLTAILAIRSRFAPAAAIAPMITLVVWPMISMLYR